MGLAGFAVSPKKAMANITILANTTKIKNHLTCRCNAMFPQIDKIFASVNTIAVHGPIEY